MQEKRAAAVQKQEQNLQDEVQRLNGQGRELAEHTKRLKAEKQDILNTAANTADIALAVARLAEINGDIAGAGELAAALKTHTSGAKSKLQHYRTWLRSPSGQKARGTWTADAMGV